MEAIGATSAERLAAMVECWAEAAGGEAGAGERAVAVMPSRST